MQRLVCLLILVLFTTPNFAALIKVKGRWYEDGFTPKLSLTEYFDAGKRHFQNEEWKEANHNFYVITSHFPDSPFYGESLYYSALCFFHLKDFDSANRHLSYYLNHGTSLQHFEEAFTYKFAIAEAFSAGAKKHLFGFQRMPKLYPAKNEALKIYDEIIAAIPSKELAMKALYSKGGLHFRMRQYKEGIETLTTLQRRFPKEKLAGDSYVLISDIYLEEATYESQNPDFISLAKINLQRFHKNFPGDDRLATVEAHLQEMREIYADTLYNVATFYERKKKQNASHVYYEEAIKRYPETEGAKKSLSKIEALDEKEIVAN